MADKRVLSVGQCALDTGSIGQLLKQFSVEVVTADSLTQATARLQSDSFALVLVNRVFDATAEPGLDLIRQMKAVEALAQTPVMLVSNYPEAQDEAIASGAVRGFGKAALHQQDTIDRLREYLG